ncbi:flagellar biosynthetic protein FliR [Vulcaniibacterium tengchongense]|uniref:Flagellar biosynthetic protein FliR n=1 Tax=Vulcaniibacterium tengchongense TaxID=1273429 RepID=A0A3N4VCW2_9GAMM|nr:flagellar biosynthetic protein FliR [Vulcaniibacterium tengchongense]RPE80852.1 flagellar biosynthetic protein FliR [Vulcaniibacterium tengchongense]
MDSVTLAAATGLDLFGMLAAVLWHALRVGAALQVLPMVGGRGVPARVRLVVALALAGALSALLPAPPPAALDAATVLGVLREFAVGIAIGLILRLAFEAGQLAGELVSQGMGLSFATLADPLSGASSPVLAQWFYLAFGLLFFAFDGHLALVRALLDSYRALPVGAPLADAQDFLAVVPGFFAACLQAGVLLALPVTVALLAVNLAFGVLARAAAQLNPIQLGLPVALLAGLLLLALLARELQGPVERLFDQAFAAIGALTA